MQGKGAQKLPKRGANAAFPLGPFPTFLHMVIIVFESIKSGSNTGQAVQTTFGF